MKRRDLLAAVLCAPAAARVEAAPLLLRTASQAANLVKFNTANTERPGICVEGLRAMQQADADLHFEGLEQMLPLARVDTQLSSGAIDCFMGMIRTPERQLRMGFLEAPSIYDVRQGVAMRRDDRFEPGSLDDIRALGEQGVVLVTRGTAYPDMLMREYGLRVDDSGTSNEQNMAKLAAGRGRFFYSALSTLNTYVDTLKLGDKLRVVPRVLRQDRQLLAYRRDLPPASVERLATAFRAIERSGQLARLRERYELN